MVIGGETLKCQLYQLYLKHLLYINKPQNNYKFWNMKFWYRGIFDSGAKCLSPFLWRIDNNFFLQIFAFCLLLWCKALKRIDFRDLKCRIDDYKHQRKVLSSQNIFCGWFLIVPPSQVHLKKSSHQENDSLTFKVTADKWWLWWTQSYPKCHDLQPKIGPLCLK